MIKYVVGDATEPRVPGNKIIAHVCNDIGGWGRGFVLSVTQRWPLAEQSYRRWYQEQENGPCGPMKLGQVQLVKVSDDVAVANMIGQHGILEKDGVQPIRYEALKECLTTLNSLARELFNASVHMPRIGCGLAGGEWSKVEAIINETLVDVDVYVYDFNTNDSRTIPWRK